LFARHHIWMIWPPRFSARAAWEIDYREET
jgi:hypothetical protein